MDANITCTMSNQTALNILAAGCLIAGTILFFAALPTVDAFNKWMLFAAVLIIGSSLGLLLSDKTEA